MPDGSAGRAVVYEEPALVDPDRWWPRTDLDGLECELRQRDEPVVTLMDKCGQVAFDLVGGGV